MSLVVTERHGGVQHRLFGDRVTGQERAQPFLGSAAAGGVRCSPDRDESGVDLLVVIQDLRQPPAASAEGASLRAHLGALLRRRLGNDGGDHLVEDAHLLPPESFLPLLPPPFDGAPGLSLAGVPSLLFPSGLSPPVSRFVWGWLVAKVLLLVW